MKNVIKFIERLSNNEWNRQNTELRFHNPMELVLLIKYGTF